MMEDYIYIYYLAMFATWIIIRTLRVKLQLAMWMTAWIVATLFGSWAAITFFPRV